MENFEKAYQLNQRFIDIFRKEEVHFRGSINSMSLVSMSKEKPGMGISGINIDDNLFEDKSALLEYINRLIKKIKAKAIPQRQTPEKLIQFYCIIRSAFNNKYQLPFDNDIKYITSELAIEDDGRKTVCDILGYCEKDNQLCVIELKSERNEMDLIKQVNGFETIIKNNTTLFSDIISKQFPNNKWSELESVKKIIIWNHKSTSPKDGFRFNNIAEITYVDCNFYKFIEIGDQVWLINNLNVNCFNNGDPIQEAKTADDWVRLGNDKEPAWCYYENNHENGEKYGKLYNWYAITDERNIAPEGFRIPNDKDWEQLINCLGSHSTTGKLLKATFGWVPINTVGSNTSGFNSLPGGKRWIDGDFMGLGESAIFWSTSCQRVDTINERPGTHFDINAGDGIYPNFMDKRAGFSVRCLKSI